VSLNKPQKSENLKQKLKTDFHYSTHQRLAARNGELTLMEGQRYNDFYLAEVIEKETL